MKTELDDETVTASIAPPVGLVKIRRVTGDGKCDTYYPAVGLSSDEREVLDHLAVAWNKFLTLETVHDDCTPDFRQAIHQAQRIVMSRPLLRAFAEEQADHG
jgi:hypothetical protein